MSSSAAQVTGAVPVSIQAEPVSTSPSSETAIEGTPAHHVEAICICHEYDPSSLRNNGVQGSTRALMKLLVAFNGDDFFVNKEKEDTAAMEVSARGVATEYTAGNTPSDYSGSLIEKHIAAHFNTLPPNLDPKAFDQALMTSIAGLISLGVCDSRPCAKKIITFLSWSVKGWNISKLKNFWEQYAQQPAKNLGKVTYSQVRKSGTSDKKRKQRVLLKIDFADDKFADKTVADIWISGELTWTMVEGFWKSRNQSSTASVPSAGEGGSSDRPAKRPRSEKMLEELVQAAETYSNCTVEATVLKRRSSETSKAQAEKNRIEIKAILDGVIRRSRELLNGEQLQQQQQQQK